MRIMSEVPDDAFCEKLETVLPETFQKFRSPDPSGAKAVNNASTEAPQKPKFDMKMRCRMDSQATIRVNPEWRSTLQRNFETTAADRTLQPSPLKSFTLAFNLEPNRADTPNIFVNDAEKISDGSTAKELITITI